MIKIIDSTLAMLDAYHPTKEQLIEFCECLHVIGITDLELSKQAYHTFQHLPCGFRFYLHLEVFDKKEEYPGIFKYFVSHHENEDKVISEYQINDVKEIIQLRAHSDLHFVRIVGLDDLLCHDYTFTMKELLKIFKNGEIYFCPEDMCHCATALAVEWLFAGGKIVITSFATCGLRAATEEVYMAMNIAKRFKPNQSLEVLVMMKELFESITGEKIPLFKPIIGSSIFQVESGIHVDGILKNPANYEAYPPEKVGQKTEIILGKCSGTSSVLSKCKHLGMGAPNEKQLESMLEIIRQISVKYRRSISDEEFADLFEEVMSHE